jgi:Family of unknown function (DUF5675)
VRLALYRQQESAISTQGELFIDGAHAAWTLERPGPAVNAPYHRIPAGTYKVCIYNSPHFGRPMPLLRDTPTCLMCEIHWGNVPGASEGCILVGKAKGQDQIFFTRDAFNELYPAIEQAVEQTLEGCSIDIFDPPGQQQPVETLDLEE